MGGHLNSAVDGVGNDQKAAGQNERVRHLADRLAVRVHVYLV